MLRSIIFKLAQRGKLKRYVFVVVNIILLITICKYTLSCLNLIISKVNSDYCI